MISQFASLMEKRYNLLFNRADININQQMKLITGQNFSAPLFEIGLLQKNGAILYFSKKTILFRAAVFSGLFLMFAE